MCLKNEFFILLLLPFPIIIALIADEIPLSNIDFDGDSDIFYQAYVQTGSELHYFKDVSYQDGLLLPLANDYRKDSRDSQERGQRNMKIFEEDITDFGKTSIGIPVQRRIFVRNPSKTDIIFEAITSTGANFHSQEKTSFRVIFLPINEEPIEKEETIILQTSVGRFWHRLHGITGENSYRIKSYSGLQIPLNATISAPIILHNPHSTPLHLLEMFTSDCHTRLEIAENHASSQSRPFDLVIEPFETWEAASLRTFGDVERNTTSFLFLKFWMDRGSAGQTRNNDLAKLGQSEAVTNILTIVIPFEIQITLRRGLYSSVFFLDFGVLKSGDKVQPLKLSVFSTLEKGIDIESVYIDKSTGVYLQFELRPPISIKSGARGQPGATVEIASVNIDTSEDAETKSSDTQNKTTTVRTGNVLAESRGGNYNVSVPFKATIIHKGSLILNPEELSFHKNMIPVVNRNIQLINPFSFPLAIYAVEIAENAKKSFKAILASQLVTLAPDQSLPALKLRYLQSKEINFTSQIILHTNVSSFQAPLHIFSGDLKIIIHSLEQNFFQFGAIRSGESRSIQFTLTNSNPVQLSIKKFYLPNGNLFSVKLMEDEPKSTTSNFLDENFEYSLPAWSSAHFKLTLCIGFKIDKTTMGKHTDTLSIQTQYSTHELPVHFEVVNSKTKLVTTRKIAFKNQFIGTISTKSLIVRNNYHDELRVLRMSISDSDNRFLLKAPAKASAQEIILQKGVPVNLANITFIPEASCPRDCYLGMPLSTSDGQWFAYGMKLPQNLAEIDNYLYSRLRRKWMGLKGKMLQTSVNLDLDRIRGIEIPIKAELIWPRLFSHSVVHFPLTAVGNFSIVNLTVTNPSMFPIIIQLLPLVIYPDADALLELFHDDLPAPLIDPIEVNETLMFSLRDTELFTLRPGSPIPRLRDEVEKIVEGPIPRFTLSMLLRPGMCARIRIGFLPSDYSLRSSLLIIRNNLTAIEPVVLYGRGARMHMEIDNKTARSQPLLFGLEPQHLSDCANPRRQLHRMPTTLTVRRSFEIKNNGEVGFSVINISINGIPCENRGYRVLNCDRFRLEPNETTFLDIAYTPDFLFSVNEATLQLFMHMNGTPWAFDLAAVIPRQLLPMCYAALPRPPFEALMYQTCVFALIFCLICVVSCAYLEGDRVAMCALKEQFMQEHEREIHYLISAEETSLQDPIEIGLCRFLGDEKRNYMQISANSGIINKFLWNAINFTLQIFSHILWRFRRSNSLNSMSNRKPISKASQSTNDNDPQNPRLEKLKQKISNEEGLKHCDKVSTASSSVFAESNTSDECNWNGIEKNNYLHQKNGKKRISTSSSSFNKGIDFQSESDSAKLFESSGKTLEELDDDLSNYCGYHEGDENNKEDEAQNESETDEPWNNSFGDLHDAAISGEKTGNDQNSGEESEVPEWADEEVVKGDIEEDFTMIAEKSATLFDMTTEDEKEKIPFKFQTDFKKSSKQSNNENFFIVAKDKETRKADKLNHLEDIETEEIIAQLTNEYQERLRKIFAQKKQRGGLFTITMPPDLTPFDWGPTSTRMNNGNDENSLCPNANPRKKEIRRKSPGSELRNTLNNKAEEKHRNSKPYFLFNISDPIWKPISELDIAPTAEWPDFDQAKKKKL